MGMKDISMRRIILIVVGVAVLSLLLLVMWNEAWGPFRGWRIKRQKTLVGGIIMHIDDIELSPKRPVKTLFACAAGTQGVIRIKVTI
jgi:hypothetical protein